MALLLEINGEEGKFVTQNHTDGADNTAHQWMGQWVDRWMFGFETYEAT
jgi:hypothetical protein